MDLAGARHAALTLIALNDAELAFGLTPLLDAASLAIADGDRIGLIGRNGTGKSSLLAVLAGKLPLDSGEVRRKPGLRVVLVEQEPVLPEAASLRDSLIERGAIDAIADERDRHAAETRLAGYLQRFSVNGDLAPAQVSGGERKRAALALAFSLEPELLLLDEPTNHLDLATKEMLVESLGNFDGTMLFVSHDRTFLRGMSNRVLELGGESGTDAEPHLYPGSYAEYVERTGHEAPGVHG
jgi:ATP-binding cassette subfamily F protein uup